MARNTRLRDLFRWQVLWQWSTTSLLLGVVCGAVVLTACSHRKGQAVEGVYRVAPGDTLSAIALAFGTDIATLIDRNDLKDPDRLTVGQKLWVPGDPATLTVKPAALNRAAAKGINADPQRVQPAGRPSPHRWQWPVGNQYRLSSPFGPRWGKEHRGVDLAVPAGTEVKAAAGGRVVQIGRDGKGPGRSYGNYLVLHHGQGWYTLYAHLQKVRVAEGAKVRQGQVIALSGNTGRSTGPHLHFELIDGIEEVDPEAYLPPRA